MPADFWAWAARQPKTYEIVEDEAVAPDEAVLRYGDNSVTVTNLGAPEEADRAE